MLHYSEKHVVGSSHLFLHTYLGYLSKYFTTHSKHQINIAYTCLLEVIPIADSEADCKLSCGSFDGCSFYTYFFPNDTLSPTSCFLLSEYLEPIQECSTCSSGPGDCGAATTAAPGTTAAPATTAAPGSCSLEMNGDSAKSIMLTTASQAAADVFSTCYFGLGCKIFGVFHKRKL